MQYLKLKQELDWISRLFQVHSGHVFSLINIQLIKTTVHEKIQMEESTNHTFSKFFGRDKQKVSLFCTIQNIGKQRYKRNLRKTSTNFLKQPHIQNSAF